MGSFKGGQDGLHGAGRRADDENTPLLGQRHQRSEQPMLSRSDTVLSASQNGNQVFSSEDEVDEEEMNLELAKTMSVPHGLGVDPLPPLINQKPKRHPSIGTEPDEDSTIKHVISSASIESKFIGISAARFWTVFGGILFGYWIAMFDSSIMASSHPVITSYFHSSNAASWLSTVFLLFNTSFQPLAGRVSDTFGRRPVYIFSIAIFFFATAWCALAQSMISFIFARGVCGIGAGGIGAMGQIITSDLVLLEYRGVYQSYVNLIFGLGLACGAAFGGFLCDNLGWRAMFGIQLPLILAYLVLAVATTPKDIGPNLAKTENRTFRETLKTFDIAGSLTLTVTVTFLILGLNLGGNIFSWTHPAVISSLVLFCVTSAFLVRIEKKAPLPVVPLELLSSQPRANLVFNSFFGNMVVNTIIFNAPLFFQAVKLESPTSSGLRLIAPSCALTFAGVSTGFFITWTRRLTPTLMLGSFLFLIGAVCTSFLLPGIPAWLAVISIIPGSAGQGFAFPSSTMAMLAVSSQKEIAVVTTTLSLFRNLGTVMGVSISSLILQNALLIYLNQMVTGVDKAEIISLARKSVQQIRYLDPFHRNQVINAYSSALRVTFYSGVIYAVILVMVTIPIKLPQLGKRHQKRERRSHA